MLALVLGLAFSVGFSEANLRGVAPQDQGKYVPDANGMFSCFGDPSIKIPFDRVNDDYCDCPDGSDEPGTAACANGKFYCVNQGHIGRFVSPRFVDDGVCDYDLCCDGSDELPGLCENKCQEIAAKHKKDQERVAQRLKEGLAARKALVTEAERRKSQLSSEISQLERDSEILGGELENAQQVLSKAEDQVNTVGKASSEAKARLGEARDKVQEALSTFSQTRKELEDALTSVRKLNDILDVMVKNYNPNFNDPAVKEAINAWKAQEVRTEQSTHPEIDLVSTIDSLHEYLQLEPVALLVRLKTGIVNFFVDLHVLPPSRRIVIDVNAANKNVDAAKKALDDLTSKSKNSAESLKQKRAQLSQNYGPGEILRALEGSCVRNTITEYEYEVCFGGKASQISKGHSTHLGSYTSLDISDGMTLWFENGARCWNGPVRKARVRMQCGARTEILAVSEPEKCEYLIDMLSPVACMPVDTKVDQEHKEEL